VTGWPETSTRGTARGLRLSAVCTHHLAPTCSRNPGISPPPFLYCLHHNQRAFVDGHCVAHHHDACAFAVLDIDSGVVDNQCCPGCALEHDAAVGPGRSLTMIEFCKPDWTTMFGLAGFPANPAPAPRNDAPEAARPDAKVRIALLEFDPDTGAICAPCRSPLLARGASRAWQRTWECSLETSGTMTWMRPICIGSMLLATVPRYLPVVLLPCSCGTELTVESRPFRPSVNSAVFTAFYVVSYGAHV